MTYSENIQEQVKEHNRQIDVIVAKMVAEGRSQAVIDSFIKAKIDLNEL